MAVKKPTIEQLKKIAEGFNLNLTNDELSSYQELMKGTLESYNRLNQLVEPSLPVKYPRTPGYRPSVEENPYNAWYWKTSIKGNSNGKLAGKTYPFSPIRARFSESSTNRAFPVSKTP